MDFDGTENGKPLHHSIELMYPEIYRQEKTTLEVGMCHVRAADSIRISYDAERDGWIIEQASTFMWESDDTECDPDWKEVAFVQAWARERELTECKQEQYITTNDELKSLYEKYPWAWIRQVFVKESFIGDGWIRQPAGWIDTFHTSTWPEYIQYRLKPKLPIDFPEPTKDMMNRAVPLGYGRIETGGIEGFTGWRFITDGSQSAWEFVERRSNGGLYPDAYYCIDINDPNSDEIIGFLG